MKNYFLVLGILFFFSCSSNFIDPGASLNEDELTLKTVPAEYDALGYGYDIMEDYLSTKSLRRPVLNIAKIKADRPSDILVYTTTEGYSTFYYGEDAYDYIKEITKDININLTGGSTAKEKAFSGVFGLSKHFNSKYSYSTKYSIASSDATKNIRAIKLDAAFSVLTNYLDPDFIADINNLSADLLVQKYGTHVLTDFTIGGRYKLIYKSAITNTSNSTTKKNTVKAGLNATLKQLNLTADIDVSNQVIETYKSSNTERSLTTVYYGGEGSGTTYNLENGVPNLNLHTWEASVNLGNCALTDINWNVTYPIYSFISNPSKKAEVIAAVNKHMDNKKIEVMKLKPMYKLFNKGINDTFYLFDYNKAINSGSTFEGVVGYVLVDPNTNTKQVYKLHNKGIKDTFYLFDYNEAINSGSTFEGFMGVYVTTQSDSNTMPVYKLFNKGINDTFFLFDYNQAINSGSTFERFMGVYIYK